MDEKVYNKKYRKIRQIGQGAFGKINLVERISTGSDANDSSNKDYLAIKKLFIDVVRFNLASKRDFFGQYKGNHYTENLRSSKYNET